MRRLVAALFVLFPSTVFAQGFTPQGAAGPAPDFNQYPSFIEVDSRLTDGTNVVLRCGYAQNGANIMADAGYMEMSFLNEGNGTYMRYQRIDNKIIMTSPMQGTPGHYLLEVVEPDGNAKAKACQFNPIGDTVQNCIGNTPFMTPQAAMAQDQSAAQQCGDFLNKAMPQLDRVTYNPAKTEAFKNGLRQKVQILEAP